MGKFVFTNPKVVIGTVDLSDRIAECEVNMTNEDVDVTAGGAQGKQRLAGLGDDSFVFTLKSDFAASKVDATLMPLRGAAPFAVKVAPVNTTISATNPNYTGNCIITEYTPIGNAIGDAADTKITLPVDGVITETTS